MRRSSDASNMHDEEPAEDEVEYSDDEAEAEAKQKLKQRKRGNSL
jgi:H/ACA ribonucleoprotein complex non-core subunit NAF1